MSAPSSCAASLPPFKTTRNSRIFRLRTPSSMIIATDTRRRNEACFTVRSDVGALKLRRELAAFQNHPEQSHFQITDAELDDYRNRHTSPKRSMFHSPI